MTNPSSPGGQFPNYPQGMNSGQMPPPPPGYPAPARGTNVMAILALVFAFVFPVGHRLRRHRTQADEAAG